LEALSLFSRLKLNRIRIRIRKGQLANRSSRIRVRNLIRLKIRPIKTRSNRVVRNSSKIVRIKSSKSSKISNNNNNKSSNNRVMLRNKEIVSCSIVGLRSNRVLQVIVRKYKIVVVSHSRV